MSNHLRFRVGFCTTSAFLVSLVVARGVQARPALLSHAYHIATHPDFTPLVVSVILLCSGLTMLPGLVRRRRTVFSGGHTRGIPDATPDPLLRDFSWTDWQARARKSLALPSDPQIPRSTVIAGVEAFRTHLSIERCRAQRSGHPIVLMLLQVRNAGLAGHHTIHRVLSVVGCGTRESDLLGWFHQGQTIGVIFTEIDSCHSGSVAEILRSKIRMSLRERLGSEIAATVEICVTVYAGVPVVAGKTTGPTGEVDISLLEIPLPAAIRELEPAATIT